MPTSHWFYRCLKTPNTNGAPTTSLPEGHHETPDRAHEETDVALAQERATDPAALHRGACR
jgi:hypothetical protein